MTHLEMNWRMKDSRWQPCTLLNSLTVNVQARDESHEEAEGNGDDMEVEY